jgi:hypothetical protein
LGKPICIENIPHYNVGQSPLQGDLRESGVPEHKITFKRREPDVVLSKDELEDMLRTD